MKKLNLTVQCMAVYNSCIEVPEDMTLEQAIEYADGTIKKFWEWYNDGKFITVIQHRNRDRLGNYYTTKHVYNV